MDDTSRPGSDNPFASTEDLADLPGPGCGGVLDTFIRIVGAFTFTGFGLLAGTMAIIGSGQTLPTGILMGLAALGFFTTAVLTVLEKWVPAAAIMVLSFALALIAPFSM